MRSFLFLLTAMLEAAIAMAQSGWTAPRLLNPNAGTQGAPFIAIGPNNVLAIACGEYPTPTGSNIRVAVYHSTDRGQTFSHSLVPLPSLPYVSMGPSGISFDRNGNLFVLWAWSEDNFPFYTSNLVLSKSTDGGSTYTTFWQTRQPLFWLSERQLFIDTNNTIHLMWDSTVAGSQFVLLYSKFISGSPSNLVTHVVPPPPNGVNNNIHSASMLIAEDTVSFFAARGPAGYYTKSIDAGATFSPYVLIDSLLGTTRSVITSEGKAVFYARYPEPNSGGIPTLRFLSDSSSNLSDPFVLQTKPVARGFVGAGGGGVYEGSSYLTYTGSDSVLLSCYYEFRDSLAPSDSAFFPHFMQTTFAIDSLGGKFLVATSYPGENRIYLMTKDVITSVEETYAQPTLRNTISASINESQTTAIISLHIGTAVEGSLTLYDILGRQVSVVSTGSFTAGENQFTINIQHLASGTYFAMFRSSSETITSKFILLH